MNTVEKINTQLARMEQNWAETQSGPFPEGVQNAIAKLRASLEEQDRETIPPSQLADPAVDVRHVTTTTTTTSAPANTAAQRIYETTTTPEWLDHVADEHHVITSPSLIPTQMEPDLSTTTAISNATIKQRDSWELATGRGEDRVRRIKEDEVRELEADQQEELDREREGIEERQDEVRGNPPLPTAHPTSVTTVREPRRFYWAMETDKSIGPIPNASDFHPTKHPSPLASPEPTPRLLDNPIVPLQPVRMPPKPTIIPSNGDVAPSVHTPAMCVPTKPHTCTLLIVHGPHCKGNLAVLRLITQASKGGSKVNI
jgi:hypothetical protein